MRSLIMDMQATLWHKTGETNRHATWTRTTLPAHWEQRRGSYRGMDGEQAEWRLEVITSYPDTVKGDKLALGVIESDQPPADAYTVIWVDMLPLRGKAHHYEVYAG